MDIKELKKYLAKGYCVLCDYPQKKMCEKLKSFSFKDVKYEDVEAYAKGDIYALDSYRSNEENGILLLKVEKPYKLEPTDLTSFIKASTASDGSVDKEKVYKWVFSFNVFPLCKYFYPVDEAKDRFEDMFFDDKAHMIDFFFNNIDALSRMEDQNILDVMHFIDDSVKFIGKPLSKRKYSNEGLNCLLIILSDLYDEKSEVFNKEMLKFCQESEEYLTSLGVYQSIYRLGYNYYEGTMGFPVDLYKAEEYLTKAYEMKEDSSVARTLGYIYYYGRTSNGVPDGDKAFKYFSVAHCAGGNPEATYKLADCYYKGIGTKKNIEAAFNLCYGLFDEHYYLFGIGKFEKLADIAFRLSTYFNDENFKHYDFLQAYRLLLLARLAIKERLRKMEYIGDRSVAKAIYFNILKMEEGCDIPERIIEDDRYLIKLDLKIKAKGKQFKVDRDDDYIVISMNPTMEDVRNVQIVSVIGLSSCTHSLDYYIKVRDVDIPDNFDSIKWNEVYIDDEELCLVSKDKKMKVVFNEFDVFYDPDDMTELEKCYTLIHTEIPDVKGVQMYLFNKGNVQEGDIVMVHYRGKQVEAKVTKVRQVYEDQLPLPVEKMDIAY